MAWIWSDQERGNSVTTTAYVLHGTGETEISDASIELGTALEPLNLLSKAFSVAGVTQIISVTAANAHGISEPATKTYCRQTATPTSSPTPSPTGAPTATPTKKVVPGIHLRVWSDGSEWMPRSERMSRSE